MSCVRISVTFLKFPLQAQDSVSCLAVTERYPAGLIRRASDSRRHWLAVRNPLVRQLEVKATRKIRYSGAKSIL